MIDDATGDVFDPIADDLVDIVVEGELFTVTVRTLDAFGNVAPVTAATPLSLTKTERARRVARRHPDRIHRRRSQHRLDRRRDVRPVRQRRRPRGLRTPG